MPRWFIAVIFVLLSLSADAARGIGKHRAKKRRPGQRRARVRARRLQTTEDDEDDDEIAPAVFSAVEHRDPGEMFIETLDRAGDNPSLDSAQPISRLTHAGCFDNPPSLGVLQASFLEEVGPADPWECWQQCSSLGNYYYDAELTVAVKREQCVCIFDGCLDQLELVDPDMCTEYCKYYQNPICGGDPYYFGVFKPYDSLAMSAQGAYDSFRYIWFSVVYFKTVSIMGCNAVLPSSEPPDRYYLHAVHANTGEPLFAFHLKLPGILYGIQNDLLTNRLVGLYTSEQTGRMVSDANWEYSLAVIDIDTSVLTYPKMLPRYSKMRWIPDTPGMYNPLTHLGFTPASAILSAYFNVFIFMLPEPSIYLRYMKDTVYVVSIETAELIDSITLDFKIMQLFANEKSGIVSGIGPREWTEQGFQQQKQVYVELGRVYECAAILPCVNWIWNSFQPTYLANIADTENFELYPGVCANDHQQNTSAIVYRNIPATNDDYDYYSVVQQAGIGIFEASLVFGVDSVFWCDADRCQGTLPQEAAYAAIYNREPGIPLSLKAPTMSSARFSLNADYISVLWDRSTHEGAKPYEKSSGGYVFPECPTDFESDQVGEFDCRLLFQEPTIVLIGEFPDTRCQWMRSDEVKIWLPREFDIAVGDTIYVLEETVYATSICRAGVPPEFSPGATGGVQVQEPDGVVPPLVTTSGATSIDACADLHLVIATDYTGGIEIYTWTFEPGDDNPEDASATVREFNEDYIQEIEEEVGYATGNNSNQLRLSSYLIEGQASYYIDACVMGRWGLETCENYTILKASIPMPAVEILGSNPTYVTRPVTNTLTANAQKSACAPVGQTLGYLWTEPSEKMVPFPPSKYSDMPVTNPTLNLPPYILETSPYTIGKINEYTFRVTVYPITTAGFADMSAAVTDEVEVFVEQSDLIVVFTPAHMTHTIGIDLFLDAHCSADPDDEASGGLSCNLPFNGHFSWACQTPDTGNGRMPCYGLDPVIPDDTIDDCRLDISQASQPPIFEDQPYCRYSQGVLAVDTAQGFDTGDYLFTTFITHEDGRTATGSTDISMTNVWLPTFICSFPDPRDAYPTTQEIRITCTEEGPALQEDATRLHTFTFCKMEANPAYDQNTDPSIVVDPLICTDQSALLDVSDDQRFEFDPLYPNLKIYSDVLDDATDYRVTLLTDLLVDGESILPPGMLASTSLDLTTAGGPPRGGTFAVSPTNATLGSLRTLEAADWVAETDDGPLRYQFGYLYPCGAFSCQAPLTSSSEQEWYETSDLPVTDYPYALTTVVYVIICTKYDACVEERAYVYFDEVEDALSELEILMERLRVCQPHESAGICSQVLNLRFKYPDDPPMVFPEEDPYRRECMETMDTHVDFVEMDELDVMVANLEKEVQMCYFSRNGADPALALLESVQTRVLIIAAPSQVMTLSNQLFAVQASLGNPTICSEDTGTAPAAGSQSVGSFGLRVPASSQSTDLYGEGYFSGSRRLGEGPASKSSRGPDRGTPLSRIVQRLPVNHPRPSPSKGKPRGKGIISQCPSAFCDLPGLLCIVSERSRWALRETYRCCDSPNPRSYCGEPPCWFDGAHCPQIEKRIRRRGASRVHSTRTVAKGAHDDWFHAWRMYTTPRRHLRMGDVSDWDRTHGYHHWHTKREKRRRLQADVIIDGSDHLTPDQLVQIRINEGPILTDARNLTDHRLQEERENIFYFSQEMVSYNAYSPSVAEQLRTEARARESAVYWTRVEQERNDSQRITRTNVLRDTLAKFLIPDLVSGQAPIVMDNEVYTMYIGKHPNLSAAMPGTFVFPDAFERPPGTPDKPTSVTNETGFSYIFIDYKEDPYAWSFSTPAAPTPKVITMIVMKADPNDPMDAEVDLDGEPVRMLAEYLLHGMTACYYWDRFAPNTPGGAWSTKGIANDDQGCITSYITFDLGLFMDGRVPESSELVEAASKWRREVWADNCVGCDGDQVSFIFAVLGMVMFVNLILILLGYVMDESKRSYMKSAKIHSRYWLQGDGVSGRLHVDDPIAFHFKDNIVALWLGTLFNVALREHAILSLPLYRETFTRPQRLWCVGAMLTGVFAVNAAVNSTPNYVQLESAWVVSGILSGLLVYPMYAGLLLMFNMRPHPSKKRIVKKQYDKREVETLRQQRDAAADKSSLKPPISQRGHDNEAPAGPVHDPGLNRLLALPAPLPLPPMPSNYAGGTWATVPPPEAMRGLPKMLALPALQQPGTSAFMPLPPPPRIPPPPKNPMLSSPLDMMPPCHFPKVGPPPQAFAALPPLQDPGKTTMEAMTAAGKALPILAPPDTGATPQQDHAMADTQSLSNTQVLDTQPMDAVASSTTPAFVGGLSPTNLGAIGVAADGAPLMDTLAPIPGQVALSEEPTHQMAPPSLDLSQANSETGPSPVGLPSSFTPPGTPGGAGVAPARTGSDGVAQSAAAPAAAPAAAAEEVVTPPEPATPGRAPSGVLGGSVASNPDGSAPNSHRTAASQSHSQPFAPQPPPQPLIPMGAAPMPLYVRAAPPSELPAPYAPAPAGPSGIQTWLPPGMPPPGMGPPVPSAKRPGPPLTFPQSYVPPPPPPPPREDDQEFIRRIRLNFLAKVNQETEKHNLWQDYQELSEPVPIQVFHALTLLPYAACFSCMVASVFVVIHYGMQFAKSQEENWSKSSLLGMALIVGLLELFRIVMLTLVELRKFETGKKILSGGFEQRRVHREGETDNRPKDAPPLRVAKKDFAHTSVPKSLNQKPDMIPQLEQGRPSGLVNSWQARGNALANPPSKAFNSHQFSTRALAAAGTDDPPPPPPPPLDRRVGPPGSFAPPHGMSGSRTPPNPMEQSFRSQGSSATPTGLGKTLDPISRTTSPAASLHQQVQILNQQVRANSHQHPPPPPPQQPRSKPAMGSEGRVIPPAPKEAPPSYNRPHSRPSSAGGGSQAFGQRPSPPMQQP